MSYAPMCRNIVDNILKGKTFPCKDCKVRKIGCHSTCKGYKDFKTDLETEKAKIYKVYETERKLEDSNIRKREKTMKRKRSK